MWKLQPTEPGTAITLLAGKEYVVGRKNCDILLANDQSISRVHARLTVTGQTVTVKDESKYGTFVNDKRLDSGATKTLGAGDRLVFGVFQSKFKLELSSVVVCSSCVDNEGKAALSQVLKPIGGRLVSSWSQECTHLVMPSVKVTIKTICALLCCRPIVKPEFFTALSKAVQQKESLPNVESFRPEIDEPSLNKDKLDLGPRPERKTLFKGKTFVFLNAKQMKRLNQAIGFGGGSSQLLEEGLLPRATLESKSSCVVDIVVGSSQPLIPPTAKKWADSVGQILRRNGLRFITESEIGLAAIYVNNETYCNPCSTPEPESTRVKTTIPGATLSQNTAVDETVLPPATLNITAYVTNTEPSQSMSRVDLCGATAVRETPEKRPASPFRSTRTVPGKPKAATEPPNSCSVKISVSTGEVEQAKKKAEAAKKNEERVKCTRPMNGSATLRKSPQKQSSLSNYFQPISKKRLREDSEESNLSEAKLSRQEVKEDMRKETKKANPALSLQSINTSRLSSQQAQSQHGATLHSSNSLGLGPAVGESWGSVGSNQAQTRDSSYNKKRKEPEQDSAAVEDLDVSLEELESIMSEDMDEPVKPAASKKQCLDQGGASTASKGESPTFSKQTMAEKPLNLVNSGDEQGSGISNRKNRTHSELDLEEEESSSRERFPREDLNVKDEEVSFVVETKVQNGLNKHSEVPAVKQEIKGVNGDPDLPRKLLQVQFKSLTVGAPCRTRSEPAQNRSFGGKNFKRFRKAPVPGLQGLPRIIGGSDLVAHNRSKNSELEEWLKDAAEEEKRQAQEETLGDDLFRYNPKPSKRR